MSAPQVLFETRELAHEVVEAPAGGGESRSANQASVLAALVHRNSARCARWPCTLNLSIKTHIVDIARRRARG